MNRVGRGRAITLLVAGLVLGTALTLGVVLGVRAVLGSDPAAIAMPAPVYDTPMSLDHTYDGEFEHFVGGGVAVLDCDDDGLNDLYVAGGANPAALFINQSSPGGAIRFSQLSGTETDLNGVTGAYPIDIDSDRVTDLVALRRGENVILRGLGDCRFERANELWQIDGGEDWSVGFSAFWDGEDALPTLAFGNYLEVDDRESCADHSLIRPADQTSYLDPEILDPGYCTLSILFSDWDRSGDPDLRMTNDRHYYREGHEQLWLVDGTPVEYTADDGWRELQIWGMGIASQDIDDDGLPEVFLTSQGDNKLQALAGDSGEPEYEDIALAAGVTAHRPFSGDTLQPSTAWHAEFDDVNNDGFTDLFVTKGNVEAQIDFAAEDPNNLLLGQPGATFVESAGEAGLLDMARSRGAAVTDLNLDGYLDVVVVERREPVKIWQNTGSLVDGGAPGNWLLLQVDQDGPNSEAVGAWVEVDLGDRILTRELTVGGGHASGESGWIHFGVGTSEEVNVRVLWPDGTASEWETLPTNQPVVWPRSSGPATWTPG